MAVYMYRNCLSTMGLACFKWIISFSLHNVKQCQNTFFVLLTFLLSVAYIALYTVNISEWARAIFLQCFCTWQRKKKNTELRSQGLLAPFFNPPPSPPHLTRKVKFHTPLHPPFLSPNPKVLDYGNPGGEEGGRGGGDRGDHMGRSQVSNSFPWKK